MEKDNFKVEAKNNASQFDWEKFSDTDLRRKFHKISDVGTSALKDKSKLKKVTPPSNKYTMCSHFGILVQKKIKICLLCVFFEGGLKQKDSSVLSVFIIKEKLVNASRRANGKVNLSLTEVNVVGYEALSMEHYKFKNYFSFCLHSFVPFQHETQCLGTFGCVTYTKNNK